MHFINAILASKDESPESPSTSPSKSDGSKTLHTTEEEVIELSDNNDDTIEDESVLNVSTDTSQIVESNLSRNESITSERKLTVISVGTPVPKSIKPNLPSLEKWSIGMGELLHFENLPTSTGAYKEKMKGIIDKVRNRFSKND